MCSSSTDRMRQFPVALALNGYQVGVMGSVDTISDC